MNLIPSVKKCFDNLGKDDKEKKEVFSEQFIGMSHSELLEVSPEYKSNFLKKFKAKTDKDNEKEKPL